MRIEMLLGEMTLVVFPYFCGAEIQIAPWY
jgi:hypothetical protein